MKKFISLLVLIGVCWGATAQSWVHTSTFPDTKAIHRLPLLNFLKV